MRWAGRRRRLAVLPAIGLGLAFASPASRQGSGPSEPLLQLGSWTAFCDQDGGCGLANASMRREARASDPDGAQAWVCVWLGPTGDDDAVLSIQLQTPGHDAAGPEAIVIEGDAGPLGTARRADDGRHEINGAAVAHIARQLSQGQLLLLREPQGGPVHERLSLAGFRQGLAYALGGRTAPGPRVEIVPQPFQPVARSVPAGLLELHRQWCSGWPWEADSAQAYRLHDGRFLWTALCARGAYNPLTLVASETQAGAVQPQQLASIVDPDTVGPGFTNLVVDPPRGRIEDLFKRRGGNDCGTRRAWVWHGGQFVLASEHSMPNCFGADHGQWLRMSATPVRGEPRPGRRPC